MEEYIEPLQIEPTSPKQQSWYSVVITFILLILYLYVAIKEYPKWRKSRENFFTKPKNVSKVHSETNSVEPKNPLLYIPFIPFAAIYLTLRIIWDAFRLFVFYSLDLIEAGLIMFWNLLIRNIKMIPKICAAIPSLWETYFQNPFLKILNIWLDWMYLYVWPIFKSTMITLWNISGITWTEGKKSTIYLWNFSVKYSKIGWNEIVLPSLEFMSWAIITFILEPGKWILSRTIYLGKIAWYCACFLARDLAEDLRDLFCVGWKISVIIYDNALQPTGKLIRYLIINIYENTEYYFPILKNFLYTQFILVTTNEVIYLVYEIFRDPSFRICAECVYSIIRSDHLYNLIKNFLCNISRKLQIIKPKLINCIRQRGLELAEFSFISVLEIVRSAYTYYTILLPIIVNIPIIYNEVKRICNEFYKNVRERVVTISKSLWELFAPLLRPIILALSFFYTTVILVILLSAFRMVKWVASKSTIALSEALVLLRKGLSTLYSILESVYNILSPYISLILRTSKKVMYELYIMINNLMAEYFPTFVNYFTGVVSRQVQIFKEHIMNAYEKYEPVVVELKDRVKVAADEAVVSVGQSMLEWVKKERALRGGTSLKEE